MPFNVFPMMAGSSAVPFGFESTMKPTDAIAIEPTPTYTPTPVPVDAVMGSINDSVTVVVGSLAKALAVVFTQSGILLVLIVASLGFMFVYWAIRLIHLRGR